MKHTMLSILALVVIATGAPLAAQQGDNPQPYEERTTPNARSLAPGSGLTITGTVISWDDKQLVLSTTTGMQHFQLMPDTVKPVEFTEGGMVSVDYTRTTQGVMIAQQIRPEGTVVNQGESAVVSETTSTTTTTTGTRPNLDTDIHTHNPDLDVDADLDVDVDGADLDVDADADLDTNVDTYTRAELPATASELPLVGVLGLLTLLAAVSVRSLFR